MERVLRAMDVIPPFDNDSVLHQQARAVPTLDLGEKILAEQRRMTARKRKGPGLGEGEGDAVRETEDAAAGGQGVVRDAETDAAAVRSEGMRDEVAELHLIVADIVARDIERLCEGLKRDSRCPA